VAVDGQVWHRENDIRALGRSCPGQVIEYEWLDSMGSYAAE
jgi:hypothetical protein